MTRHTSTGTPESGAGIALEDRRDHRVVAAAREGVLPGEHLVQDDPGGEDVASRIDVR